MLYYFHQVEIAPSNDSKLGQTMPEVNGAFINCVVKASSERAALAQLQDALQSDGYIYLENEKVEAVDGTAAELLPELDRILAVLENQSGDVAYGEFHCYE